MTKHHRIFHISLNRVWRDNRIPVLSEKFSFQTDIGNFLIISDFGDDVSRFFLRTRWHLHPIGSEFNFTGDEAKILTSLIFIDGAVLILVSQVDWPNWDLTLTS